VQAADTAAARLVAGQRRRGGVLVHLHQGALDVQRDDDHEARLAGHHDADDDHDDDHDDDDDQADDDDNDRYDVDVDQADDVDEDHDDDDHQADDDDEAVGLRLLAGR
jgi:hypothetical protein